MEAIVIDPSMTVDEIMRRWPGTIRVFIRNRMHCIGCPIGVFHTVADACAAHGLDEDSFSRELLAAMRGDVRSSKASAFDPAEAGAGARGREQLQRPISPGGFPPRA